MKSLLEEGDALIFRIAIGLYSLLSARLYAPDKQEVSLFFSLLIHLKLISITHSLADLGAQGQQSCGTDSMAKDTL